MRQLIMAPPTHYKINGVNFQKAQIEWNNLRNILLDEADVDVIVCVNPPEQVPTASFVSTAGAIFNNLFIPATGSTAITEPYFSEWAKAHQYDLFETNEEVSFAGSSDLIWDRAREIYWYGCDSSSSLLMKTLLDKRFEKEDISINRLQTKVPLNTCFAPLDTGHCLWYPPAFTEYSRHKINFWYGDSAIAVDDEDFKKLACSTVSVGNIVVVGTISNKLLKTLKSQHLKVHQTSLDEFVKLGCGAQGLTLDIVDK